MHREAWTHPRKDVEVHDHAVFMYREPADLLPALGRFIQEGILRDHLVVFVHAFSDDAQAWRFVEEAAPGEDDLKQGQVVVVSLYTEAFEGGAGRIDHEHVARVVTRLTETAHERGWSATRIFVDASRQYFAQARTDEWFAFENWLGRRLAAKVSLVCAYREADVMREDIFPRALQTHAYRFGV